MDIGSKKQLLTLKQESPETGTTFQKGTSPKKNHCLTNFLLFSQPPCIIDDKKKPSEWL